MSEEHEESSEEKVEKTSARIQPVNSMAMCSFYDTSTADKTGRVPWYGSDRGKPSYIVGVAGGTASGKTSVCREVKKRLKLPWVQILSMDNFYKGLGHGVDPKDHNFDHPDALDWKLIIRTIQDIKRGLAVQIPEYDFKTHSRLRETTVMYGADVVLFEGILTLHDERLLKYLDLKVFVVEDDDIRLIRRIRRDMRERKRTLESVLSQYQKTVKPSYDLFCAPTQRRADIIIPRGKTNTAAIDILATHIRNRLEERGVQKDEFQVSTDVGTITKNVHQLTLPDTLQQSLKRLYEESFCGKDVVSEVNKITTLLIELGKSKLEQSMAQIACYDTDDDVKTSTHTRQVQMFGPNVCTSITGGSVRPKRPKVSIPEFPPSSHVDSRKGTTMDKALLHHNPTPTGEKEYRFLQRFAKDSSDKEVSDAKLNLPQSTKKKFCGVVLTDGGYIMEAALHKVLYGKDIASAMTSAERGEDLRDISLQGNNRHGLGTIHVLNSDEDPNNPRFYFRKLPSKIASRKVILVDYLVGTGNRARMALHVLLDHHVNEEDICFVCLVSTRRGISSLARSFRKTTFVTAQIMEDSDRHILEMKGIRSLVERYCSEGGILLGSAGTLADTFDT